MSKHQFPLKPGSTEKNVETLKSLWATHIRCFSLAQKEGKTLDFIGMLHFIVWWLCLYWCKVGKSPVDCSWQSYSGKKRQWRPLMMTCPLDLVTKVQGKFPILSTVRMASTLPCILLLPGLDHHAISENLRNDWFGFRSVTICGISKDLPPVLWSSSSSVVFPLMKLSIFLQEEHNGSFCIHMWPFSEEDLLPSSFEQL